jgi:nucleotide-binding universal stress UspA family protein
MGSSASLRDGQNHRYVMVVGLDFDQEGDLALTEALELARHRDGSELHVLHVVEGGKLSGQGEALDTAAARLRAHLDERLDAMPGPAQLSIVLHTRLGEPAAAITKLSADVDADLIVVGNHERGPFTRLLSPSIGLELDRKAHCPVLVVKPKTYGTADRSAYIEPPCPECLRTRQETAGARYWCEQHSVKHAHGHTYSYHRDLPFRTHDASTIPTGIDPSRVF